MRATAQQIEELRTFETPIVANALDRLGLRPSTTGFASAELRSLTEGLPPVAGIAITCVEDTTTPLAGPGRGLADLFRAIDEAEGPSIVVIQDSGLARLRSCHLGDVMATSMQRLGAVAFVTDGAIRDLPGIRTNAAGFHVYASGTVPAEGEPTIVSVGSPVSIHGLQINTGDLLHADSNGLQSVPMDSLSAILEESRRIARFEKERSEYLRGPDFSIDSLLSQWIS